ncbi:Cysteine protease atg4a [Mortierella alpina]|nr:Cysteine protease atg4a [Mortierella alpina]
MEEPVPIRPHQSSVTTPTRVPDDRKHGRTRSARSTMAGASTTPTTPTAPTTPTRDMMTADEHHARDNIEFWASLYAQHPVYSQQDPTSSLSLSLVDISSSAIAALGYRNSLKQEQIKVLQVLIKADLPTNEAASSPGSTRPQFALLSNNTSHRSASFVLARQAGSFSVVLFFAVKKADSRTEDTAQTLWLHASSIAGTKTAHEHRELMGSFAVSPINLGSDGVAPFYIYETELLDYNQLRDERMMVLNLKMYNHKGKILSELSYTLLDNQGNGSSRGHDRSWSGQWSRKPRRRDTVATGSASAELGAASGRHSGATRHGAFDDGYHLEIEEGFLEPAVELNSSVATEEPDAGEHFMQATSEFLSKMGYWLYNSRVVQYIAKDERNRTKSSFATQDIWMLGVCYRLQPPQEQDDRKDQEQDGVLAGETRSANVYGPNGPLPHSDRKHARTRRLDRSNSISQCTAVSPQRSTATSSISNHEAQSHSHARHQSADSAGLNATRSTALSGGLSSVSAQLRSASSKSAPASASASPRDSRHPAMTSEFSNLGLECGETNASLVRVVSESPDEDQKPGPPLQREQPSPTGSRKTGQRRMTMSGIFMRGPNAHTSQDDNTSAPKGLAGPTARNNAGMADDEVPRSRQQIESPASLPAPEARMENTSFSSSSSTMSIAAPSPGASSLVSIPKLLPSASAAMSRSKDEARTRGPEHSSLNRSDGPKRERRRKTSKALFMQGNREARNSEYPHQAMLSTASLSRSSTATMSTQPKASVAGTGDNDHRRQNSVPSMPSTHSSPNTQSKASSIRSVSSSSSSPPSPSSQKATTGSGSVLRRSWRSLSVSLASAKSALPLGLASPSLSSSFSRSLGLQELSIKEEGAVEEEDGGKRGRISLPPSTTAYLSLLRPGVSSSPKQLTPEQETLRLFMMDFQSRLWFTYRKDLARIEPSFYTCDSGWGCMMRTGQSLLAQAFLQAMVKRDWRAHLPQTDKSQRRYKRILNWFLDEPEREYSIHRIAKEGLALDKRIGEWFGPSTVAHVLRRLSEQHEKCPLTIQVPMDGTVRVSSIMSAAMGTEATATAASESASIAKDGESATAAAIKWKPVMLLLPTRFGLDKLTAKYATNLKQLFRIPQFLGIAGGRPGRSLYFVACQGDELFYFDPHFVKPRVALEELGKCPAPTFHCSVVRSMDILELDPSMLLGFLIRSQEDLDDLIESLDRDMERAYPLLTVVDDREKPLASSPSSSSSLLDIIDDMDAVFLDDPVEVDSISVRSGMMEAKEEERERADEEADRFSIMSLDDDEEFELEGDASVYVE